MMVGCGVSGFMETRAVAQTFSLAKLKFGLVEVSAWKYQTGYCDSKT